MGKDKDKGENSSKYLRKGSADLIALGFGGDDVKGEGVICDGCKSQRIACFQRRGSDSRFFVVNPTLVNNQVGGPYVLENVMSGCEALQALKSGDQSAHLQALRRLLVKHELIAPNGVQICDLCRGCELPTVCYGSADGDFRYSGFAVDGAVKKAVRLPEGLKGCRARQLLSVNPKDRKGIALAQDITMQVRNRLAGRAGNQES